MTVSDSQKRCENTCHHCYDTAEAEMWQPGCANQTAFLPGEGCGSSLCCSQALRCESGASAAWSPYH